MNLLVKYFLKKRTNRKNYILSYSDNEIICKISKELNIETNDSSLLFDELKKFLYISSTFKGNFIPSAQIDEAWHIFILFTTKYKHFCQKYLKNFVHHIPLLIENDDIEQKKIKANSTLNYLKSEFQINKNYWEFSWNSDGTNCTMCEEKYGYGKSQKNNSGCCYIATICYGGYDSEQVILFRKFRDEFLSKTIFGIIFLKIYYKSSYIFNDFLIKNNRINSLIKHNILEPIYSDFLVKIYNN